MESETTQTLRAIFSLICRVVLLGIAVPVLLGDFPQHSMPSRITPEWSMPAACDALAVLAPLLRWRKLAFLAGVAALSAHYYYARRYVPVWDMAYMGVAIVLVLLPASGRESGKRGPNTRSNPLKGKR